MLRLASWQILTDVSEVPAALIIALMMVAVSTSETSVKFYRLYGAMTRKASHLRVAEILDIMLEERKKFLIKSYHTNQHVNVDMIYYRYN
jgi:hypothetical protein